MMLELVDMVEDWVHRIYVYQVLSTRSSIGGRPSVFMSRVTPA
jgi:hypothetical protein